AGQVHGYGSVTSFGPMERPFGECRASSAVHQNHAGERARAIRFGEVGEDARLFAFVWLAFVVDFLEEAFPLAPGGCRRAGEGAHVPKGTIRLGVCRNAEKSKRGQRRANRHLPYPIE